MRRLGNIWRYVPAFSVMLLIFTLAFSPAKVKALPDCCILDDIEPVMMAMKWTCLIGTGTYECEGVCAAVLYFWQCLEEECDNTGEVGLYWVTGPCYSRSIWCDGEEALCAYKIVLPVYAPCSDSCPDGGGG